MMHLNHATAATAMATSYQHYPPPQISTHAVTPTTVQQQTTIAAGLQQSPFALHQLTAVQAIQHPTHQAMLHPQHPLVHLLDISSTTSTPNPTPISPPKIEVQTEEEVVVDDPRKKKQCHVCKNKFRQLTTLRNHMKIHTDERPYKCKHCEKAFRQISTLTNHVKIHTGEKPFTCNICAKDFRQQSTLINHIKTHKESSTPTSLLNYQPPTKPSSRKGAQNSYQNRTPISKNLYSGSYNSPQAEELVKPYQCNICKRRFPHISTLRNHENTHLDPKPFKCESCDKCFSQQATLANHKKIHTGDKPYTCSYCSMNFRQQSTLSNHMKTHATAAATNPTTTTTMAGTAPPPHGGINMPTTTLAGHPQATQLNANMLHQQLQFEHPLLHILDSNTTVSTIVPKEQYNANERVTQVTTYKGECPDRPFVCGVCRRAFSQHSTLNNHIKTHTGEKPYKCKVCETNFRQVSTLNNHMKIHTGEKPYACSYCPKQFRQKSTLINHVRIHTC
ncbi:gastrula zinc finger protein XlCGF26.1-like isoform X1 [Teleopsis dalmanni]|uniref:gastrula zinc finger protein XlCGF26.1-like isoform X1 n=1 Tax=Teleopsis dalmanni TaxID=139649 RepID=UPI0018CED214|nr:gastrula zinc finger protein XlCGF26.1-like isoform X1 [Teleopsis dalmanni]XP_037949885.1 gastrula zinc finger protein XlCGF26.1-like isoform X1 [Teleopsis dalmanni]